MLENSNGSKRKPNSHKGNTHRLSADFSSDPVARREWHSIFRVMKGKTYNQEYFNQQGSHSNLTEKSKALQTSEN